MYLCLPLSKIRASLFLAVELNGVYWLKAPVRPGPGKSLRYPLSKEEVTETPCTVWRRENLMPLSITAIPFFHKTFKMLPLTTAAVMRKISISHLQSALDQ